MLRAVAIALLWTALTAGAEAPPPLTTVCEILKDMAAHNGKVVLVIARFSFRRDGRFLSQEACTPKQAEPGVLWLTDDSKTAPKVPPVMEIDRRSVEEKLQHIRQTTALKKFRFGSPEYDNWAVVYGQVQRPAAKKDEPSPAHLLIRSDGAIVFLY